MTKKDIVTGALKDLFIGSKKKKRHVKKRKKGSYKRFAKRLAGCNPV
jgi:hypothetical protein